MSALMPPATGPPPQGLPPIEMDSALKQRVAAIQRRFYALADASADDPRVDALIPEMTSALLEAMAATPGLDEVTPAGDHPDWDLFEPAFATALETVPPAQRRILRALIAALLRHLSSEAAA